MTDQERVDAFAAGLKRYREIEAVIPGLRDAFDRAERALAGEPDGSGRLRRLSADAVRARRTLERAVLDKLVVQDELVGLLP